MIDDGLERPWPNAVRAATKPFRQGHLIERPPLFYAADLRHPVWATTRMVADETAADYRGEDFVDVAADSRPPFGIITTQSCDLAEERPEPRQPWLAVAPVYRVPEASSLLAREYIVRLEPPSFVGVWVADLRIEMPLEKSLLVGRTPIEAFATEDGYIRFANLLARRRGRPALASVFHDVLTQTARAIKNESGEQRALARRVRGDIYNLLLAIEDGTRLEPVAARLYVATDGPPGADIRAWFDRWWNDARIVGAEQGLQLHPIGWIDARAADLRLLDDLVEMRNPLFG